MTASELAFMALGLLLGVAAGAALLMAVDSRSRRGHVHVTVTRDAVPSRSKTLSQDAFVAGAHAPAPGGPGDRRTVDRDAPPSPTQAPLLEPAAAPASAMLREPQPAGLPVSDRTIVPSGPGVAVAIHPEPDRELEGLRRRRVHGTPIEQILRGDHLALVEVVDEVAGTGATRRTWEVLLGGFVAGMADIAVHESVIDFPMSWWYSQIGSMNSLLTPLALGPKGWKLSRRFQP